MRHFSPSLLVLICLSTFVSSNTKADVAAVFGNTIQLKSTWCLEQWCINEKENFYISKDGTKTFLKNKKYGLDGIIYSLGKETCTKVKTFTKIEGIPQEIETESCGKFNISGNRVSITSKSLRTDDGHGFWVDFTHVVEVPQKGKCRFIKSTGTIEGEGGKFPVRVKGSCRFFSGRKF